MNRFTPWLFGALVACGAPPEASTPPSSDPTEATPTMPQFHALSATTIDGKPFAFEQLKGRKVLIVNTASECGYTPQYAELQDLYAAHKDKGLVVLGFPSNDFGGQEPGTTQQIATFCRMTYGVTFPMFHKVVTKAGPRQSAEYTLLGTSGHLPAWNFAKYLIGKDGSVVGFFPSNVAPDAQKLRAAIDEALARP